MPEAHGAAARTALACAAAFALLTVAVVRGWTAAVDDVVSSTAVATALRSPELSRGWQVVEHVTQPVCVYTVGVVSLILVFRRGRRRDALAALAAGSVAAVASPVVKTLVGRPRPALEAGLTSVGGASFPSGHALASGVVVLSLLVLLLPPGSHARQRLCVAGGAAVLLVVGVDRVWLGAHWPSDVLGGWLLAGVLVATATALARRPLA